MPVCVQYNADCWLSNMWEYGVCRLTVKKLYTAYIVHTVTVTMYREKVSLSSVPAASTRPVDEPAVKFKPSGAGVPKVKRSYGGDDAVLK